MNEQINENNKRISDLTLVLKKIYGNLICPIDYVLIKNPVVTPTGITFNRDSLINWLKKRDKIIKENPENKPGPELCSLFIEDETQLYPSKALENIIKIINMISEKYELDED